MAEDSKCFACGKAGADRQCSKGCGAVIYCNKKCQNAHFRMHKVECQKACSRKATTHHDTDTYGMGQLLPSSPDIVNVHLEPKIFSLWERSKVWYDRPIVLHCHPKHSDFRSYQMLTQFVGVYSSVQDVMGDPARPFPIYAKNRVLTDSLFGEYQCFSKNEKEYRSNHGDWLNEFEHFENLMPYTGSSSGGMDALLSNDPRPTKELLSERNQAHDGGVADEVVIVSSHGERDEAARKIQRLLRNRQYNTAYKNLVDCINYFQKWKTIVATQQQVRRFLATKREIASKKRIQAHSVDSTIVTKLPLASIPNRWADLKFIHEQQEKWQKSLFTRSPFFVDDAECIFCGVTLSPDIAAERRTWCHSALPHLPYKSSSERFNQQVYGESLLCERGVGSSHSRLESHGTNLNFVHATLNKLSTICARVIIGETMLKEAVNACESEAEKGGPFVSWYLFRKEEFLNLRSRMISTLQRMQFLCIQGDIQQLRGKIKEFENESHEAQSFLTEKRKEEEQLMSTIDEQDSDSIHDVQEGNDDEEDVSDDDDFNLESFVKKRGGRNRKY